MALTKKQQSRTRRHHRIRAKIIGSAQRPRLSVFRSNKHIYAQVIDDDAGKVLCSYSDILFTTRARGTERAKEVGSEVAKRAKEAKITRVVFDRAGYAYHGIVKALADGAREQGLIF